MSVAGLYEMAGVRAVESLCLHGAIRDPGWSICIDVGANIDIYTTTLAKHFGTIIAFEPHPVTSRLLAFNAEIN